MPDAGPGVLDRPAAQGPVPRDRRGDGARVGGLQGRGVLALRPAEGAPGRAGPVLPGLIGAARAPRPGL